MKTQLMLGLILFAGISACQRKQDAPGQAAAAVKYQCPMHPAYISDKPGNCPICGMRLVPMENETTMPAAASAVPGQATIRVNPERQQLIGVSVSPIAERELTTPVRASARVAYDPNLYNALYEYQQVLAASPKKSSEKNLQNESAALVRASILRLRQMGLSESQIQDAGKPGFDPSNLLLPKPGGPAWVYIDIYDFEASIVKPGQKASLTSSAAPGKIFPATIRSIDSVINSETRTLRARAEVLNVDGALRPEMYLDAVIHVPSGKKLAVPATAVIDTGTRQLVYVEKSPGEFEPRLVTLGKKAEDFYEVIAGVKEGENVVTSANFLIDSESKLKAATQGQSHDHANH